MVRSNTTADRRMSVFGTKLECAPRAGQFHAAVRCPLLTQSGHAGSQACCTAMGHFRRLVRPGARATAMKRRATAGGKTDKVRNRRASASISAALVGSRLPKMSLRPIMGGRGRVHDHSQGCAGRPRHRALFLPENDRHDAS